MSMPIFRTAQLMRHRPAEAARFPPTTVAINPTAAPSAAARLRERDEKAGMTDGIPSARVQQAARDLKRGVTDTSRGPEADAAYRKLKQ